MFVRVQPWIGLGFRIVLAGILGYAGLIKLFEPGGARLAIAAYRIFPPEWAQPMGYALPILEVLLALLLLVGLFTRWAALLSTLLMVGFVAGIISVWVRGYSIDCGCFGGGGDVDPAGVTWRYTSEIIRDVVFGLLGLWLVIWPRTRFALDRGPVRIPDLDETEPDQIDSSSAR